MAPHPRGVLLLLAVLVYSAAATLDAEEQQKEARERESARRSGQEAAGAADEAPAMPQNLQVMPQSDTVVMMVWDPSPGGVDRYLVYVQDEDMEDTTEIFFYIWEGLEACTDYTFGVRAVSSEGDMSEPALDDGKTLTGIPPEPQNFRVESFTHNSATLRWDKPDTLCDIEHYRLTYGDEGEGALPEAIMVSGTTFSLSDLEPETKYTFSVYASTSTGEGPAAITTQTTEPDPGGPPQDLIAEGISSTAINVSWSAPNSDPEYYKVEGIPCMYANELVDGHSYIINNVKPCETCLITVTSYYSEDRTFPATTMGKASSGAPPPPEECSVEVHDKFLTVNWVKPKTTCALGPYNVSWTRKKLWGSMEEVSDSINITGISYTLYQQPPHHEYSFEISASIDDIFGRPTSCGGTSSDSPAGPPKNVTAVPLEQGVARITWDNPVDENGEIIQYGIFVNEEANYTKTVGGDEHSTTVSSLEPCVNVGLSVKALNHAGWGQRSGVQNVTVPDDVLPEDISCSESEAPVRVCWKPFYESCPVSRYNLKWTGDVLWSDATDSGNATVKWVEEQETYCHNITSTPHTEYRVELSVGTKPETVERSCTSPMEAPGPPTLAELYTDNLIINVTWNEPEVKNGVISAYKVEWADWSGGKYSDSTDGHTLSYEIVDAPCGGMVNVTVSAATVELGARSPPRSVFLVNSIFNLECEPTEPGVIALSWEVEDEECPIHMYNVTWTFDSLWSNDDGSKWDFVQGDVSKANLDSLPPYSNIVLAVHVDNSPEASSCSATTVEEAASPPTDVDEVANDTSSVTVAWSLPEAMRGKLVGWHLSWSINDDEPLGTDDVTHPNPTIYKIRGLRPSTTYTVSVAAVNGAGAGDPALVDVRTANLPPVSHLGLILGVSIGGGVLLIIILVGGFIIYKKKNKIRPPRPAPNMPDVIDSDIDKLYKKQHQSSASQRFQSVVGTIDRGTNSELYHNNNQTYPPEETGGGDEMMQGDRVNQLRMGGDRRSSQQVSSSLSRLAEYNRRPSQQVNIRMRGFEEYNRRSSQQNLIESSEFGGYDKRPSYHEPSGRPNLKDFGRRPSQHSDIAARPNLKEFGRRPSQQIDVGRLNMMEHGRHSSQQIQQERYRFGEYSRRPSQQGNFSKQDLKGFGRRPSEQIDLGRPGSREFARRPSQQASDIGGRSLPSRTPQPPVTPRSGYDHYMRRPSQQADIGMPGDRAFMKRPSRQFNMNFEGIQE